MNRDNSRFQGLFLFSFFYFRCRIRIFSLQRKLYDIYKISEFPVISFGCGIFMTFSMVGAISARQPFLSVYMDSLPHRMGQGW